MIRLSISLTVPKRNKACMLPDPTAVDGGHVQLVPEFEAVSIQGSRPKVEKPRRTPILSVLDRELV
jgi:hypothetical protein